MRDKYPYRSGNNKSSQVNGFEAANRDESDWEI